MTTPVHMETILSTARRAREHISTRQAETHLAAADVSPARQPAGAGNAPEAAAEDRADAE